MNVTNPLSDQRVVMAHGGGGQLMQELIRTRLLTHLKNETLQRLTDGAILPQVNGPLVFTTDSYVVTPIEFPGGDIGKLAVAGTVNDLAVMGAEPLAISLALILEEGLPLERMERVISSVAATVKDAGVAVVTGDTKVVERRGDGAEGLLINTAGIGRLRRNTNLAVERIQERDCVLVNGPIAEHGLAIMSVRNGLEFETPLRSDVAPLNHLIARLLDSGADVKFMRDATRGGVAGVLADICEGCGRSVEIDERRIPLSPSARHAAEMLGLDPLTVANEGKVISVVAERDRESALAALRSDPLGRNAACIGVITGGQPPLVELVTRYGGRRIVQRPYGEELPRIC